MARFEDGNSRDESLTIGIEYTHENLLKREVKLSVREAALYLKDSEDRPRGLGIVLIERRNLSSRIKDVALRYSFGTHETVESVSD